MGKDRQDVLCGRLEAAQAKLHETPRYQLVQETGPDHDKVFEVAVIIGQQERARATGRSKKEAEQRAAEAALATIESGPK